MATEIDRHPANISVDVPEMDVTDGYAAWASNYDAGTNPLIVAEEPVVHGLIDRIPAGRALDAACGTGSHTQYLRSRGHQVTAVDLTPEMLAMARAKAPDTGFCLGSLASLPFVTASFDLAVCSLALDHAPVLDAPIRELARVVRPGGAAIISDFHPISRLLGGGAVFRADDGSFGVVRGFHHDHAEYVSAFVSAGFDIRECLETRWNEREIGMVLMAPMAPGAFNAALAGTPIALVWLLVRG
jgi:SAM-dependent methyltransferase